MSSNFNTIKRSKLDSLIREIVKSLLKEGFQSANMDDEVLTMADKAWGKKDWFIRRDKNSQYGRVYQLSSPDKDTKLVWLTPDNEWKTMDLKTRKWTTMVSSPNYTGNPSENVKEMSTSAGAGPVSTPFAFKKTKGMKEGSLNETLELTATGSEDDFSRPIYKDQNGRVYVDINCGRGTPSIHSVTDEGEPMAPIRNFKIKQGEQKPQFPDALCPRCKNSKPELMSTTPDGKKTCTFCHWEENPGEPAPLKEMTTTGDVAGYNIPGAFAKKGGSEMGIKGSEALGYTLTPQGKQDMNRKADKLQEEN